MASSAPAPRAGDQPASLSIGALSAATGVPVETIRTWERRYGFPVAERKPSGHRLYPLSTVPRLRRVAQAIAAGHRAAEVVSASEQAIEMLLAAVPTAALLEPVVGPPRLVVSHPVDLIDAVRAFDTDRLRQSFQFDWARLGPLEFLERRAVPFLAMIGSGWVAGTLDVRHEHVASACLGDFLRTVRAPYDEQATGPVLVLATLNGEMHGLGLQMCAMVVALAGWRALILGVDTPVEQIVALTRETSVGAIAVSCVQEADPGILESLQSLRRATPRSVPIVIGGAGVPDDFTLSGVDVVRDLPSLDRWVRTRSTT